MSDLGDTSVEGGREAIQRLRASNRRVAWTLSSIAIVFFAGIIATRWLGGAIGIGVMGSAVLLFLVVAIGRSLRRTDGSESENDPPERRPARADS
jgi:hypothetical protein